MHAADASADSLSPAWVRERPDPVDFLVGIGAATMANPSTNTSQTAHNRALTRALHNITTQLGVHVTATTAVQVLEDGLGVHENFERKTHLYSTAELEGTEIVDTWVGNDTCWVYARLDKVEHDRRRRARLDNLRKRYDELLEDLRHATLSRALASGMNALQLITPRLGASSFDDGEQLIRRQMVLAALRRRLSSLRLQPLSTGFPAVSGTQLSVAVEGACADAAGLCAQGLPVRWSFASGSGELTPVTWTDDHGRASTRIRQLDASADDPTIVAIVDLNAFSKTAPTSQVSAAAHLPTPRTVVVLSRPRITARLKWDIRPAIGRSGADFLAVAVAELAACGIDIIDGEDGQVQLELNVSVRRRQRVGSICFALLDVAVTVERRGERLFRADAPGLKGAGTTAQEAMTSAFEAAESLLHEAAGAAHRRLIACRL